MLLRSCLIHISIILRHFLYLLYLCPCLELGLFMSHMYDLFFVFIFIFIAINHVISWNVYFCLFLDDNVHEEQKFSLSMLLSMCLFVLFQSGVAYKSAAYKKTFKRAAVFNRINLQGNLARMSIWIPLLLLFFKIINQ